MMKSSVLAVTAIMLGAGLTGCATVTRGTDTKFSVLTTPTGAAVTTSTGFSCSPTPCGMKMPRKDSFDVTITRAGYAPATQHIRSSVGGGGAAGMAGNILLGGVIGMAVDGSNGAMNDLSPNPLILTLAPLSPAGAPATASQSPIATPSPD